MDGFAEELSNFIDQAHRAAEALSNSPDLNPDFARREAESLWRDAVQHARALAAEKLAELQKRHDVSAEKLAAEAAKLDAMLEPERISAAVNVATIQANTLDDPADFERIIRRAVVTGDRHALQAWADVGLPILTKRLPDLKMRPGDLEALKREVDEALTALEPDTLKKARQEAAEAENALAELQSDLDRVNTRWSRTHGGRGPLADQEPMTVVEHKKDGKLIIRASRWP